MTTRIWTGIIKWTSILSSRTRFRCIYVQNVYTVCILICLCVCLNSTGHIYCSMIIKTSRNMQQINGTLVGVRWAKELEETWFLFFGNFWICKFRFLFKLNHSFWNVTFFFHSPINKNLQNFRALVEVTKSSIFLKLKTRRIILSINSLPSRLRFKLWAPD